MGYIDRPFLQDFKRRANAVLPGRVASVILFGSRARGEASSDSDWDVAVFLRGGASASDLCVLADAAYDLIVESGQFIQPVALALEHAEEDTLLMRRIRQEGVPL